MRFRAALAGAVFLCAAGPAPQPPSIEFGPLFRAVQLDQLFSDQKTFPDMVPDTSPASILADYEQQEHQPDFSLRAFVRAHFQKGEPGPNVKPAPSGQTVQAYIQHVWNALTESANRVNEWDSLLALPHPYVVPGGRFEELYYWDTYFILLGLVRDKRRDLLQDMVADLAYEIDTYGHVPNGNRSYYVSRSQPPFFSLAVDLLASVQGDAAYTKYLPELRREWDFFMAGSASLSPGAATGHVVRLADGTLMNRYWDERDVPRDESYQEDVATAGQTTRPSHEVYRDLRAAAEAGWDFSSRWLKNGTKLASIRTTQILPVDLNCLMLHLEQTLSRAYAMAGQSGPAGEFAGRAASRGTAIHALFWDAPLGAYTDYLWSVRAQDGVLSGAALFPLFLGVATQAEADTEAKTVASRLVFPGGLATTLTNSGQQWDFPDGWAPLQYVAVTGLRAYGNDTLAHEIAAHWTANVLAGFEATRTLYEKYDVRTAKGQPGAGGEYSVQLGFGWTNGVLLEFFDLYPDLMP